MKGVHGLVLVPVVAVGILLGILARGGVERVSEASPVARAESLSGVQQAPLSPTAAVAQGAPPGSSCIEDSDCPEYTCSDDACECGTRLRCEGGGFPGQPCSVDEDCFGGGECREEQVCNCTHTYNTTTCPPQLRETHFVTTVLNTNNARSIGIGGVCFDENLGPTVPPEECVFSVEAVQYRRSNGLPTFFKVVCVDSEDQLSNEDTKTCSPVEREPLGFGIGPSVGFQVKGKAGAAAAVFAGAAVGASVSIGFSAPVVFQRKLRYPVYRHSTGRAGGNILIESGIGSVVANESVVFGHDGFDGEVTFFVSKPKGMKLAVGYKSLGHPPECLASSPSCPAGFLAALETAAAAPFGSAASAGSDQTQVAALESDFDIQELVDALDNETQAIQDIIEELKGRIEEKIPEAFETLQNFLGSGGSSAATAERSVMVDKMMSLLRDRITSMLDEIRQIARDMVACPDN